MLRTSDQAMTHRTTSEISALSERVGKTLRAFGNARARHEMTSDEVLIFLAIGHLDQTARSKGKGTRPVSCLDLAALLNIPKETVRRKMARLVDMQLATLTTRGAFLSKHAEWQLLAEAITGLT